MDTPASLLERLRHAHEPAAWSRFVDLYTPILFAFAGRLGLQAADAADLVQGAAFLPPFDLPRRASVQFRHRGRVRGNSGAVRWETSFASTLP
jgi:RNA polymerase sigma-70 factor (ECF subfamily)